MRATSPARACAAIGLVEGPVHAELRIDGDRVWVIEVAARSIGGLCARALRFGAGIALEEVILRHALGMPLDGLAREPAASGVMMLPIPHAGVLARSTARTRRCGPRDHRARDHRAPWPPGGAAPEGDRYLGFLFARARRPPTWKPRCDGAQRIDAAVVAIARASTLRAA